MSVVCAAIKNGEIAISCDTRASIGSLTVSDRHLANSNKLYPVNGSVIGMVGWSAVFDIVEHLLGKDQTLFRLNGRAAIFTTFLQLHKKLKEDYFIEIKEEEDQPVESSQLEALIVNESGLFHVGSYREVNEYKRYWAVGSGNRIALGAMHARYEQNASAREIAESGVRAAAEFDDGCGLPLRTEVLPLQRRR